MSNEKLYTQDDLADAVDIALFNGFQSAVKGTQAVLVGFDDCLFKDTPQKWADSETPLFNIQWCDDRGDPSVGIQGFSGWILAADQSGTMIHDMILAEKLTSGAFFISGPKTSSAIVYTRDAIEPVIVALAKAHGFDASDYTSTEL